MGVLEVFWGVFEGICMIFTYTKIVENSEKLTIFDDFEYV